MKALMNFLRHLDIPVLLLFLWFLFPGETRAEYLTLEIAEQLALRTDPGLKAIQSRKESLDNLAVAASQLQDPRIKFGVVSLPVDTFQLGQEPMTQVQLGVQQHFPRGRTRQLSGTRFEKQSQQQQATLADQKLQIVRDVRWAYLEVFLQKRLATVLEQSAMLFHELNEITTDYYASGRAQQQDVLSAQLEYSKVQDRLTETQQKGDMARVRLTELLGAGAFDPLSRDWPELESAHSASDIQNQLLQHPRLQGLTSEMEVAETGIELARQRYKPGFTLDASYGARGGNNSDGSSRPDFMSVMVTMDLPLFATNRQDRVVAARVADSASAGFARDDAWRRLRSEVDYQTVTLGRIDERITLYEKTLLPQAEFYAEAAFEAYQDATGDLTSLVLARVTQYELSMDYARLRTEKLQIIASLLYLSGEAS